MLKSAVANARLGRDETLAALQRLDAQARALEREAEGPSVEAVIATEMAQSQALGGRSVFGWEPAEDDGRRRRQFVDADVPLRHGRACPGHPRLR